jgi:hypothetical protein
MVKLMDFLIRNDGVVGSSPITGTIFLQYTIVIPCKYEMLSFLILLFIHLLRMHRLLQLLDDRLSHWEQVPGCHRRTPQRMPAWSPNATFVKSAALDTMGGKWTFAAGANAEVGTQEADIHGPLRHST